MYLGIVGEGNGGGDGSKECPMFERRRDCGNEDL